MFMAHSEVASAASRPLGLSGLKWAQARAEGGGCFLNFIQEGQRALSWLGIQLQLRRMQPAPKQKVPGHCPGSI